MKQFCYLHTFFFSFFFFFFTPCVFIVSHNLLSLVLVKITKREYAPEGEWINWQWRSINDEYMNGAFFREAGSELKDRPFSSKDMITAKPGKIVGRLTRFAGALKCRVGRPC